MIRVLRARQQQCIYLTNYVFHQLSDPVQNADAASCRIFIEMLHEDFMTPLRAATRAAALPLLQHETSVYHLYLASFKWNLDKDSAWF